MTVTITRKLTGKDGTFGIFNIDDQFTCMTLELPDKNNQRNVSCIPAGKYSVVPHNSPRFGKVYKILNVPNRTNILFHSGNTIDETKGCIMLGILRNQTSIRRSRKAFEYFNKVIKGNPFTLIIKEDYGFEWP